MMQSSSQVSSEERFELGRAFNGCKGYMASAPRSIITPNDSHLVRHQCACPRKCPEVSRHAVCSALSTGPVAPSTTGFLDELNAMSCKLESTAFPSNLKLYKMAKFLQVKGDKIVLGDESVLLKGQRISML